MQYSVWKVGDNSTDFSNESPGLLELVFQWWEKEIDYQ
jgi:hypothetical protein